MTKSVKLTIDNVRMGDGLNSDGNKSVKMGATSNSNSARMAALQERKKTLEETIAKRNQELRDLCLKEAELTGITPSEIPNDTTNETSTNTEPKVGARYQLPQNLLSNISNEDESLEIQIQLHLNLAEAALSLANDNNLSKTIRKQHYEHYKQQYRLLQQKKEQFNKQLQVHSHLKPKKKLRTPEHEDAVSVNITSNISEHNFGKSSLRHSMRSLQHSIKNNDSHDHRFSSQPKLTYQKSDDNLYLDNSPLKHEDSLPSSFYKLNVNKNDYECFDVHLNSIMQYPTNSSSVAYSNYPYKGSLQMVSPQNTAYHQDYHYKRTLPQTHKNLLSNTFPKNQKLNHFMYPSPHYPYLESTRNDEQVSSNPLQIQPHQQYEHDVMPSGLGGYWKRKENGEMIWCQNNNVENDWQRDKRCGSLDRRKNRRLLDRISPSVDPKSSTLSSAVMHADYSRQNIVPVPQTSFRSRQDCHLVRTQSLGSVGVNNAVDNVYPSDDNSSCGSETLSCNDTSTISRKQKQKEWYETLLDDFPTPSSPKSSKTLSTIPSIMPDVKYTEVPHANYVAATPPKPVLEIPAESNPSPRILETNIELFNNNVPKNCTVVLPGHCKPYHEETKPFEMADFYKYSTKFKNSPGKSTDVNKNSKTKSPVKHNPTGTIDNYPVSPEVDSKECATHKGIYQPLQPMKCQPYRTVNNVNIGHTSGLIVNIRNQEHSPRMNEHYPHVTNWYRSEDQPDKGSGERSARSTATLV